MNSAGIGREGGGLAPALVRKVFSVYFCLAVSLTAVQVGLDYRETYSQVVAELDAAARAFEPGVADAVWNYQEQIARSIAHGMVDGRLVLGVSIRDRSGQIRIDHEHAGLDTGHLDVSKRIELFHVDRKGRREAIGDMVLHSNQAIVLARVQYGLMLTLLMSVIKTIGLWIIIVRYANRMIAKPLEDLTQQVGGFDVANAQQAPTIDIGTSRSIELRVLRDAFNDLGERVVTNRRALAELAATLDGRVQERTGELIDKNRALLDEVRTRQAAESALTRERDFSLALVRAIPGLFVLLDRNGMIVMANPSARRALGLVDTEYRVLQEFVPAKDRDAVAAVLAKVFDHGEASCEADLLLPDIRLLPCYMIAHRVQLDDQPHAIIVAVDISMRRAAEEQMRQMALHDALTRLPNRAMLHERLLQAIAMAHRHGHAMAVLFLDLDGFKSINDRAGHEGGDAVLCEVANRLTRTVRASDTVARYGGDEFVVVLSSVADARAAASVAKKLIDAVSQPIGWAGEAHSVGASVGISLMPDHSSDPSTLIEGADAAMYRAKRRGKGCHEFADRLYGT